jgi:hypothetical protein
VTKDPHKKKILALFLKYDIPKAFNTINWPYLLDILRHLGFGLRWRNWISALWNTASSTFLLNGEPGKMILHCRGVRQGEPLHKLIAKAQDMEILTSLNKRCNTFRMSLYANDTALFISPSEKDFKAITEVLNGLNTNLHKSKIYTINCDSSDLHCLQNSGMVLASFPCKYLSLPLHYRKPTREMMHPLV